MIIIGEKLNSSIPKTFDAMKNNDESLIIDIAKTQENCGADYIDINTAIFGDDELNKMSQIVKTVTSNTNCGIVIDSPNPEVTTEIVKNINDRKIIINSVTLSERLNELLPVVKEYKTGVIGLPIGEEGMPESAEERRDNALKLIDILNKNGVSFNDIYIDILVTTLATDNNAAKISVKTIELIKSAAPEVHLTCGLSNISFGLPARTNINSVFLSSAVFAGLDSAIMDITNKNMKASLFAAMAVSGNDDYCIDYIESTRNK